MADNFCKNGTAHIRNLIAEGIKNNTRTATVTGKWEIDEAILIPSDFTLCLEDCHLRMADTAFDNMFRNEHCGSPVTKTAGEGNSNIRILGRGEAILDGGRMRDVTIENVEGFDGTQYMKDMR